MKKCKHLYIFEVRTKIFSGRILAHFSHVFVHSSLV